MVRKVHYYSTETGKAPFLDWISKLDMKSVIIIDRFTQRAAQGGDKKTQTKDIIKAREYWRNYGK